METIKMEIQAHGSEISEAKSQLRIQGIQDKRKGEEAENSKNILKSHYTQGVSCYMPACKWTFTTKAF